MQFYRKVYRLDIKLKSPLAIGSGKNENTDKDVAVDSTGKPFIPASSLAGTLRSYVAAHAGEKQMGVITSNAIFGFIPTKKTESTADALTKAANEERKCLIRVYDGMLKSDCKQFFISNRDMVALKDKVGVDGAKFDMEAVETGTVFTAYVELLQSEITYDIGGERVSFNTVNEIEKSLGALNAGDLCLGSKTSRGYGAVSVACWAKTFTEIDTWLKFDMMDDGDWADDDKILLSAPKSCKITVGLRLKGGISIREYTTQSSTENETMPDYKQLSLHRRDADSKPVPVIPGTSWSGAFRARYLDFVNGYEEETQKLFGFVEKKENEISRILNMLF